MTPNRFFGYGSLVNVNTHHRPLVTKPRQLKGWRREWAYRTQTPCGQLAVSLTAAPSKTTSIDGVLVDVSEEDWPLLDQRERGYDRLVIDDGYIYSAQSQNHGRAKGGYKILQSYLDAVCQGYLRLFGEEGLERFFDTTDGWEGDIRNDRLDPLYPRAIKLLAEEQDLIDHALKRKLAKI